MAAIAPFNGIRYDPTAVGDLSQVVAPPYDVIAPAARDALEELSPYNIVRLILPREGSGDERPGKYTQARALLETWLAAGVLCPDDAPSITIYEQRFELNGARRTQRGILAAVRLDDPSEGGVLPHERTYDTIVQDRLDLLRATETNLDCILCVYDGTGSQAPSLVETACAAPPIARFTTEDDGTEHVLWRATDPGWIDALARALEKPSMVIADGHHRWQTARQYRDERRATSGEGPWDWQLMFLVDASSNGPALLPIHRALPDARAEDVLRAIAPIFDAEQLPPADPEEQARRLASAGGAHTFVMFDHANAWRLTVKDPAKARAALPADRSDAWRDLDVALLHAAVFDGLLGGVTPTFVHTATEAAEAITQGGVAFLLAPMPFDAVRAVAEAGDAMPQKSTYFVPKPKTGVVLRALS